MNLLSRYIWTPLIVVFLGVSGMLCAGCSREVTTVESDLRQPQIASTPGAEQAEETTATKAADDDFPKHAPSAVQETTTARNDGQVQAVDFAAEVATSSDSKPKAVKEIATTEVKTQANGQAQENSDPPPAPLFVDWPKPQVVLVFSGQQHGYLEPCGCTGLERQKGGVMRRATFLNELRQKAGT